MNNKLPGIITILYALAVCICIPLAFDFEGFIDATWTLVLVGLTLPWSLIAILFSWALIHGAGLGFFTIMFLVFAGLNSFLIYRLCVYIWKKRAGAGAEKVDHSS